MLEVRAQCDACDAVLARGAEQGVLECPSCRRRYPLGAAAARLEQCPICDCRRFFRQKAFPKVLGIGLVVASAIEAMARQPETAGVTRTTMFLGIAFTEALALIGFVLFFIA